MAHLQGTFRPRMALSRVRGRPHKHAPCSSCHGAILRTMPHYLTCTRCGNLTPSLDLAHVETSVPGAYVIVCKWCDAGESRPSQDAIMENDDRRLLGPDDEETEP